MLGDFVKRFVNGLVLLLAALTFFLVPIGRKTAAQHCVAIFSTPPAREAATAFAGAARKAATRAGEAFADLRESHKKPAAPRANTEPEDEERDDAREAGSR